MLLLEPGDKRGLCRKGTLIEIGNLQSLDKSILMLHKTVNTYPHSPPSLWPFVFVSNETNPTRGQRAVKPQDVVHADQSYQTQSRACRRVCIENTEYRRTRMTEYITVIMNINADKKVEMKNEIKI